MARKKISDPIELYGIQFAKLRKVARSFIRSWKSAEYQLLKERIPYTKRARRRGRELDNVAANLQLMGLFAVELKDPAKTQYFGKRLSEKLIVPAKPSENLASGDLSRRAEKGRNGTRSAGSLAG